MAQSQQPPSLEELRNEVSRMLENLDAETPIAATVLFQVDPRKESTFVRNLDTLAEATRKLPGLDVFSYHRHKSIQTESGETPVYLIYENWQTRVFFQAQWDSDHLQAFQATVFDLVTAPPDLQFYYGAGYLGPDSRRAQALATGQKRSWDAEGNLVDDPGRGDDGDLQAGLAFPDPAFVDNGDGTVTDQRSGLVWLKDANAFGEVPWEQALANAKGLAEGAHGLSDGSKAGDWRLPNVNELQSLVDLDSTTGAALPKGHPFKNLHAANYWSSSTVALAPPLGWYVALSVAPPVFDLKMNSMRMWPVRGGLTRPRLARTGQTRCYNVWGQPVPCEGSGQDGEIQAGIPHPDPRFTDNGDGTVTDNLTGLIWLQDARAFGSRNWENALEACNELANGDAGLSDGSVAGDWRLPNVHELRSLIDYDHFGPALTPGHPFKNVRPSLYWSSTTVASAPNQARFVFVGIGPSVWDHKSVLLNVWPVRGGTTRRRTAQDLAAIATSVD